MAFGQTIIDLGKTADNPALYKGIPLAAGGTSVVVSGSITAAESFTAATGTAVPANAAYIGGNKAGNLVGLLLDANGNVQCGLYVKKTVAGDTILTLGQVTMANSLPVTIASDQSNVPVSGTFWQATQPVSLATLPALAAGSAVIGSTLLQVVSGTPLQADQSNTILKNSLYVKKTTAGDTVLALGSTTSANSLPVVIASDQGTFTVIDSRSAATIFSTTQTAVGSGNSGDLNVSPYDEIAIDINLTAFPGGTNPTIQYFWDRKGIDGIYYPLYQSAVLSSAQAISTSIGPGTAYNQSLAGTGRLRWVLGGTNTPTATFTPNVIGK